MTEIRKKPQQNNILTYLDRIAAHDPAQEMGQEVAEAWVMLGNHPFFKDILDRLARVEYEADKFTRHDHLNGGIVVHI